MNEIETETWDLAFIRDYINNSSDIPSADEKKHLIKIVDSIDHSISIFRYHGIVIHKEDENCFKNNDVPKLESFLRQTGYSKQALPYAVSRIACEANFIACVHTVRNMYDIFSQLINRLLLNPAITRNCDFYKVLNKLPDSPLKAELESLKNSDGFKYISAFSNTVKHNALIGNIALIGRRGPRIKSFEYKGEAYDKRDMMDALDEVENVLNAIIQCGRYFNEQLIGGN